MASLSTLQPLVKDALFISAFELVKTYTTLCLSIISDQPTTLFVDHSPNNNDVDITDAFTTEANVGFFKMVNLKSKYYRLRLQNVGDSNQTYLRCYVKPSNSSPDDMNIHVNAEGDSILMFGQTASNEKVAVRVDDNQQLKVALDTTQLEGLFSALDQEIQGIQAVNDSINAMASFSDYTGLLTGMDGNVASIASSQSTLHADLETANGKLETLGGSLTSIDGNIASIATSQGILHADLEAANDKLQTMTGLSASMDTLNLKAVEIKERLDDVYDELKFSFTYYASDIQNSAIAIYSGACVVNKVILDNENNFTVYFKFYDTEDVATRFSTPKFVLACPHDAGSVVFDMGSVRFNNNCYVLASNKRDNNEQSDSLDLGAQSICVTYKGLNFIK